MAVGVPDDKFGEVVAAVVEPVDDEDFPADQLIAHVRTKLANYKAPKYVFRADHRPRPTARSITRRSRPTRPTPVPAADATPRLALM